MKDTKSTQSDLEILTQLNADYLASDQNGDVQRYGQILAEDFMSSLPDFLVRNKKQFLGPSPDSNQGRPVTASCWMPISDSLFARSEVRAMRALRKEFIMLRRKRIVTACAALLFAVTGHAMFGWPITMAASAQGLKVSLSGDQEVPPVSTSASGNGTITVSPNKSVIGNITVSGMEPTAAHIHEGAQGENGPVVIPLTKSSDNTWSVPAGAKLTDAQYKSYVAGKLYVNVHSAVHKDGEIRAQLSPKIN